MLYDDDEYYLGGVLAELLAREGRQVTIVTEAAYVSAWSVNTMDQPRIQRRLLELGVGIELSHAVVGATGRRGAHRVRLHRAPARRSPAMRSCSSPHACRTTAWARSCSRAAASGRPPASQSVRIVGDAYAPSTIAAAVWDGHRFAEELDGPEPDDAVPYRREVTELQPVVHTVAMTAAVNPTARQPPSLRVARARSSRSTARPRC